MWTIHKLSILPSIALLAAGSTSAEQDFVWALEDECTFQESHDPALALTRGQTLRLRGCLP
jgi:hypothetical protein